LTNSQVIKSLLGTEDEVGVLSGYEMKQKLQEAGSWGMEVIRNRKQLGSCQQDY
jgi:hypothetical protein